MEPQQLKEIDKKPVCAMDGCKRKLKLVETTTMCKCSKAFCVKHRHAEDHSCDFDYQGKGQRDLSNALVKMRGEKLNVI
jgi:hypothetical protein